MSMKISRRELRRRLPYRCNFDGELLQKPENQRVRSFINRKTFQRFDWSECEVNATDGFFGAVGAQITLTASYISMDYTLWRKPSGVEKRDRGWRS